MLTVPVPIPEATSSANEYLLLSNVFWSLDQMLWIALPLIFVASGAGKLVANTLEKKVGVGAISIFLYSLTYFAIDRVVRSPIKYFWGKAYAAKIQEPAPSFVQWLPAQLLDWMIFFLMASALTVLAYFLIKKFGSKWWVAAALITIILSSAYLLFEPYTQTNRPLVQTGVEQVVAKTAALSKIPASQIRVENCNPVGSCPPGRVIGLGPTRIMVMNEGFMLNNPERHTVQTVAHESKHFSSDDNLKAVILISLSSIAFFYLLSIGGRRLSRKLHPSEDSSRASARDIPVYIFVASVLFIFLSPPINFIRRSVELSADIYSLNLTKDCEAQATMLAEYTKSNNRVADPGRFYTIFRDSHPSDARRIQIANECIN